MIPIPGTSHVERLEENTAAVDIRLTDAELDRIERISPKGAAAGTRYDEVALRLLNQ